MTRALLFLLLLASAATYGAFRAGALRGLARYRHDPSAPPFVRRLPFITLPVGAFALAGLLMAVVVEAGPLLEVGVLAGVCALLVALVMAAAWLAWSPPDLLKPAWLRQEEGSRPKLQAVPPPARDGDPGPHRAASARAARAPGAVSQWRFAWQQNAAAARGDEDGDEPT